MIHCRPDLFRSGCAMKSEKEGEIRYIDDWETLCTYNGPLGIVELKRGEHDPSTPTDYRSEKLPLLFKALNEDSRSRGYKGELK